MDEKTVYKFSAPIEVSGIIRKIFCQKADGWSSFLLELDISHRNHTNINAGIKRNNCIQCTGNISINIDENMHIRIKLSQREQHVRYGYSFAVLVNSMYPIFDDEDTVMSFFDNANDLDLSHTGRQSVITDAGAVRLWKHADYNTDMVSYVRDMPESELASFARQPDLVKAFVINFDMISALMSLHECMTLQIAKKAYKQYGKNAYNHILAYPYDLAIDLNFDMHKTDWIACDLLDMYFNDENRKNSLLVCAVSKLCLNHKGSYVILNDTSMQDMLEILNRYYLQYKDKTMHACYLIPFDADFATWVRHTIDSDERLYLTREGVYSLVYIRKMYDYETGSADIIADKINHNTNCDMSVLQSYMSDINKDNLANCGYEYDDEQKQAIINVFSNKLSVITGGAGSGKSSLIRPILQMADRFGLDAELFAPTHKAKNRIRALIGKKYIDSCDIDTLAGCMYQNTSENTKIDEVTGKTVIEEVFRPLASQLVIIDESSMMCLRDLYKILKLTEGVSHVVFIGDYNQLPSIEAGCCFEDMCKMSKHGLAVTNLTGNYRAEGKTIADNSIKINSGDSNIVFNREFAFYERSDDEFAVDIANQIKAMVDAGIDMKDICCLSPVKDIKYHAGTEFINNIIQQTLNPYLHPATASAPMISNGTVEFNINYHRGWCFFRNSAETKQFRIGDRVICMANHIDENNEITNGSTGVVTAFEYPDEQNGDTSKKAKVIVDFDDYGERAIKLGTFQENFQLAYCITIHKSQGSEYKHVILALTNNLWLASFMINRNLLYTAVTRAQKSLSIYGSSCTFYNAVFSPPEKRASLLSYRTGKNVIILL